MARTAQERSARVSLAKLSDRLRRYVQLQGWKPEGFRLLDEALIPGEFERGEIERITGLPERTARRLLAQLTQHGLLGSETPKGPVSLRVPARALEDVFPRIYMAT